MRTAASIGNRQYVGIHNSSKLMVRLCAKQKPTVIADEWDSTILPVQFRRPTEKDWGDRTGEEKLAWAFLERLLMDISSTSDPGMTGKARSTKQLRQARAIAETYLWMADDSSKAAYRPGKGGFEYSFEHWCDLLEIDEGYMRRGLRSLLSKMSKELKAQPGYRKRKLF